MGNSISLACCPNKLVRPRGEVMVIKEDGESLRVKDGTLVRDLLSAYPYHKIIRCCSERTVLPLETQLSCNWLYFLLPVGLALSQAVYQSLVRSAASQILIANGAYRINIEKEDKEEGDRREDRNGIGGLSCSSTYKWKPILRSIPEIASPST